MALQLHQVGQAVATATILGNCLDYGLNARRTPFRRYIMQRVTALASRWQTADRFSDGRTCYRLCGETWLPQSASRQDQTFASLRHTKVTHVKHLVDDLVTIRRQTFNEVDKLAISCQSRDVFHHDHLGPEGYRQSCKLINEVITRINCCILSTSSSKC